MSSRLWPNAAICMRCPSDKKRSDAALIEQLDRPRMKTTRVPALEILVFASLDDDDVDPRERELGRQHQTRRASSSDHNRMTRHRSHLLRSRTLRHGQGLPARPVLWHITEVEGGQSRLSFFFA